MFTFDEKDDQINANAKSNGRSRNPDDECVAHKMDKWQLIAIKLCQLFKG